VLPLEQLVDNAFIMLPEDDGPKSGTKVVKMIDNHLTDNVFVGTSNPADIPPASKHGDNASVCKTLKPLMF